MGGRQAAVAIAASLLSAAPSPRQNRKRVRPPGSVAKVTIAERGSMRYTFHGGGPCDGALTESVNLSEALVAGVY